MRFVDLFAGLGGFHRALADLGFECVFASELDPSLRAAYEINFPDVRKIAGDIRDARDSVPAHDVLCAGFPCQPFSKSGRQEGFRDPTRGTLFHEILAIARRHEPDIILLENVGNFARHDGGNTWRIVRETLEDLGYSVRGTEHKADGGHGLISPHHFGIPHRRDRFFAVATKWLLPHDPFPARNESLRTSLESIVVPPGELTEEESRETWLSQDRVNVIDLWNQLISRIPDEIELPSFPLWADEIGARYPFESATPYALYTGQRPNGALHKPKGNEGQFDESVMWGLPPYAQVQTAHFPEWKRNFIRQNRSWWTLIEEYLSARWLSQLMELPHSMRKLEWNCKGEQRDLWHHVLQFRPSGLRVKRYASSPALVAMTASQVPILGPERRFLSIREGKRLQGLPDDHMVPKGRERAFAALGNAVNAVVVKKIMQSVLATREID